jgi:peroxiredoxin
VIWRENGEALELEELLAAGPILLLFYLFDWSPTWTQELRLLRDREPELTAAGVRAFGVSRDSHWSHRAWKEALGFDVSLLSDWNGTLAKQLAAARTYRWMNGVPERSAFLLGEDGTVRGSWRYADTELPDFDELVAAVQAWRSSS